MEAGDTIHQIGGGWLAGIHGAGKHATRPSHKQHHPSLKADDDGAQELLICPAPCDHVSSAPCGHVSSAPCDHASSAPCGHVSSPSSALYKLHWHLGSRLLLRLTDFHKGFPMRTCLWFKCLCGGRGAMR